MGITNTAFNANPTLRSVTGIEPSKTFARMSKDLLRADLEKMASGDLGISEIERDQIVGRQRLQASAENAALQAALSQQALASGGGLQGQQLQALRSGQEGVAQAAARGAAAADEASRQQAAAEEARIRNDLHAQQDRGRQNAQVYSQMALGTATGLLAAPEGAAINAFMPAKTTAPATPVEAPVPEDELPPA